MKMKEVVSTMVRGGIPAALLLWSVQCMAFRRPSQTRPRVDVSVQQNVFSPTTMDTTVDVTIIKELPPPKYALWDGVETALRHLQLRGVPLTFDNVNEELYVMHKNNDIHLPYDPYWSGKMKRPLTKKKREKALFEEQLKGLTGYQLNFIRALCDGVTSDFGSKVILETYNLGSKSNISRIKSALQDKEMIDFDKDTVYLEDPVFKIWYKRNK